MDFPEFYHIGCLKTGTTSLQKVLSEDDRINLILYSRYFNTDKLHSGQYHYYKPGLINIESDENMVRRYRDLKGLRTVLERIKEVRPDAKIILTIREQRSMILSMYKHHIRQTHAGFTPDQFLESEAGSSFLEILNYGEIFKEINSFFAAENIFIFLFENLKSDFQNFITSFYKRVFNLEPPGSTYAPIENIGLNDRQVIWKRRLNKLYLSGEGSKINRIEHFLHQVSLRMIYALTSENNKKHIHWGNFKLHKPLEEKFRTNNAVLQKLTGLNLKDRGYLT